MTIIIIITTIKVCRVTFPHFLLKIFHAVIKKGNRRIILNNNVTLSRKAQFRTLTNYFLSASTFVKPPSLFRQSKRMIHLVVSLQDY